MDQHDLNRCLFFHMLLDDCLANIELSDSKISILNQYFIALAKGEEKEISALSKIIKDNNWHLNIEIDKTVLDIFNLPSKKTYKQLEDHLYNKLRNKS